MLKCSVLIACLCLFASCKRTDRVVEWHGRPEGAACNGTTQPDDRPGPTYCVDQGGRSFVCVWQAVEEVGGFPARLDWYCAPMGAAVPAEAVVPVPSAIFLAPDVPAAGGWQ